MKAVPVIILALLLFDCGKKRSPQPLPQPTPVITPEPTAQPTTQPTPVGSPIVSPSASPIASPVARATPYPTPLVRPFDYLPKVPEGKTVIVSGENLAEKIQAAQDDLEVATVRIEGGGSITKQVILRKHTEFDSLTYSIDVQGITDQGAFLITDGVLVEGTWRPSQALVDYWEKGDGRNPNDPYLLAVQTLTAEQLAGIGTTLLEPTYADVAPAVEVFQALGDTVASHTGKAANIAVMGFHVRGRQKVYDGGVRSTILFGNCHRCAAIYNYLEDTASIGITFGGSALEEGGNKNNFANDVVAWRNVTSGVAAANIATINTENSYTYQNYVRRPAHHEPRFGGGVCGYDHETNSDADHTKNIWVFNNLYDFEGSALPGNALCLQDPYHGLNHGVVYAVNNIAIGGRGEHSDNRFMSNGIFLNGLTECRISNNYVFRTGQNALQAYAIKDCLIEDNDFESTGGGGNPTMVLNNSRGNTFRRNNFRERPGLTINTQAGFVDVCGERNVFEGNLTLGQETRPIIKPCP